MFDRKIENIATIMAIGLIIVSLALVIGISKSKSEQKETISVTGSGELTVMPDEAKIYVEVVTLRNTAVAAQEENAKISNEVVAALEVKGIKSEDIQTKGYNLYEKTEWNDKLQKSEVVGYELSHTLEVTTLNLDSVGDFLDIAVNAGANRVNNVVFDLTKAKEQEVNSQALSKATGNARAKAEGIVKDLNVKLGEVVSVSESNTGYTPYVYYRDMAAGAAEKTTIQPSEVTVNAYIGISYEIK